MRWTVLIPLKALPAAKSRLVAEMDPAAHAQLVEAIRADTLVAARAAASVARVVVVADQPGAFDADVVLVQQTEGLNGALREAAAEAARRWPADGVAALVGDLPALVPTELDDVLVAAAEHARSFVPDAAGTGTTVLAATPGAEFVPEFGIDSAARHRENCAELAAGPTVRADVDTQQDLADAARLGLGRRTAGVIARSSSPGIMSS